MNESLRRALLRARLTEDDVAARLEVDPKTVRRWLEDRVPYPRHRWMLAATLGLDEVDLWPQLATSRSRPQELHAIYPHLDTVPREVWLRLFSSSRREIDILAESGLFFARDPGVLATLSDRARAGVTVRICLHDSNAPDLAVGGGQQNRNETLPIQTRNTLIQFRPLGESGAAEIRLYHSTLVSAIYRADDELVAVQNAYGVPVGRAPVLHLNQVYDANIVAAYRESFERIWKKAYPAVLPEG